MTFVIDRSISKLERISRVQRCDSGGKLNDFKIIGIIFISIEIRKKSFKKMHFLFLFFVLFSSM